ncbi:MAG: hypothetical protein E6J54_19275 [Deltaproteobacteria bacterium]|nr:MAG: hypothetical protein E6J54_19275 [Deltaproteobacteria bacterium]
METGREVRCSRCLESWNTSEPN